MKKIRLVLSAFIMLLLCLFAFSSASAETAGSWVYREGADGAYITAYTNTIATDAQIPVQVDGLYVVGIDSGAFVGCSGLERLFVPITVTEIAEDAFPAGICIQAYNGSAALAYAQAHSLTYDNLSTLAFTSPVVDLTGIDPSAYSYITSGIRLHKAYARTLQPGSLFFLPPDQRNAMGDGYVVRSMTMDGDYVTIMMAEADPQLVLERISVHATDFTIDPSGIDILDEGVSDVVVQTPKDVLINVGDVISITFKDRYVQGTLTAKIVLSEIVLDIDMYPFQVNKFSFDTSIDTSVSMGLVAKANNTKVYEKELVRIPFASAAGTLRAYAIIALSCDLQGSFTATVTYSMDQTLSYTPEAGWNHSLVDDGGIELKAAATVTPKLSLPRISMWLPVVEDIAEIDLVLAMPVKAEIAMNPLHPATKVCTDLSLKATVGVEARVGLNNLLNKYANASAPSFRLRWESPKHVFFQKECHAEDGQIVEECTKENRYLYFDTGCDVQLAPISVLPSVEQVHLANNHYEIARPGYTLRGWYYFPDTAGENVVVANRTVTLTGKETTIYAIWDPAPDDPDYSPTEGPGTPPVADTSPTEYSYGHYSEEYASRFPPPHYRRNIANESHVHYPTFEEYCAEAYPFTGTTQKEYENWYDLVKATYENLSSFTFGGESNSSITSRSWDEGYQITTGAAYSTALQSVSFHSTMSNIGSYEYCTNLTTVGPLPAAVTTLGKTTFRGCTSLKALDLSSTGITYISNDTFRGLTSLEEVLLSPKTETIGNYAFADTPSLKSIQLYGGKIYANAFSGSGLESVVIPETTTMYGGAFIDADCLKEAIILSPATSNSIAFMDCDSLETVVFGENATYLNGGMFKDCYNLTHVSFPQKTLSIGYSAFENCVNIQSFKNLEIDVSLIGDCAFHNVKNIETVHITGDYVEIGRYAFANTDVKQIIIDCNTLKLTDTTFAYCQQLEELIIRANASENALGPDVLSIQNISSNVKVTIQLASPTSIGFSYCPGLTELNITCPEIPSLIFHNAYSLASLNVDGAIVKGSVTDSVFKEFKHHLNGEDYNLTISSSFLERVELTGQVGSISKEVFRFDCPNLREIVLPRMTGSIGREAFSGCAIEEFTVPDGCTSIDIGAFAFCRSLTSITIPNSVQDIFGGFDINYTESTDTDFLVSAFNGCTALNRVHCNPNSYADQTAYATGIPAGVGELKLYTVFIEGEVEFYLDDIQAEPGQKVTLPVFWMPITQPYTFTGWFADKDCTQPLPQPFIMPNHDVTIYAGVDLHEYQAPDENSLVTNGSTLVYYDSPGAFLVPDGITTIAANAIGPSVEIVRLPSSVIRVESGAFAHAHQLRSIKVDGGNTVFISHEKALYTHEGTLVACPQMTSGTFTVREGTHTIRSDAFYWEPGTNSFDKLILPESLQTIGQDAFVCLSAGTGVYGPMNEQIANTVMSAGLAYNRYRILCFSGEDLLGVSDTYAGWLLPEIAEPTQSGKFFTGWSTTPHGEPVDLLTFTMPCAELMLYAQWSDDAHAGLTWVILPDELVTIEESAFENAPIQAVRCPLGLAYIADRAFLGCTQLQVIEIPSPDTVIAPAAFLDCNAESLTIIAPEGSLAHQFAQENGLNWDEPQ